MFREAWKGASAEHILVHLVQKLESGAFPDARLPREFTQPNGNSKFGCALGVPFHQNGGISLYENHAFALSCPH
jgi:hypothetical protein